MAVTRPWVTPEEVRAYTDFADVQSRSDTKLAIDITRAEQAVIAYTGNKFDDAELEEIPANVKTAVILLAESYAHKAHQATVTLKSETYDDYSYTASDSEISVGDLGLEYLLDEYKISTAAGKLFMRLRKL